MDSPQQSWLTTRAAGVLAHVSTLPGDYGIGNLGPGARRFIDLLFDLGIRYWQICPIGPTGYGDSPYQCFSGSAGNPYFIDLGELESAGLLKPSELAPLRALDARAVDYGRLHELFWPVLSTAYDRFESSGLPGLEGHESYEEFRMRQAAWLEPYAEFMALKEHFGGRAWTAWPLEFRSWTPELRQHLPVGVRHEADRHSFYQYIFFGQWHRLRRYASERGVGLIGDVPIFVAMDSADTWCNRAVFRLGGDGLPVVVAGVPPDYFSALGQLWGNPLYDWKHLAQTGYAWWVDRLRTAFSLYDIIRLDHFRGFESYWEIPSGATDARVGTWRKGPGLAFFEAVRRAIPTARIIAEDLGYIGPDVVALRRAAALPGMKILQFGYGHDANNVNLPHFFPRDSVAYTGTHDNLTTRGWLEAIGGKLRQHVDEYFGLNGSCSAWPMIRVALASVSRLAVFPIQDLLDLGIEATFNRPGTADGNWRWRFSRAEVEALPAERLSQLRHWINLYDRSGDRELRDYSEAPLVH